MLHHAYAHADDAPGTRSAMRPRVGRVVMRPAARPRPWRRVRRTVRIAGFAVVAAVAHAKPTLAEPR